MIMGMTVIMMIDSDDSDDGDLENLSHRWIFLLCIKWR